MHVFDKKKTLNAFVSAHFNRKTIGMVPTMGALHSGHLSLVKRAVLENECVVVSIFVNPTQFNNEDDLKKYPKTLAADIKLLESVSKNILVFAPTVSEVYGNSPKSKSYNFGAIEQVMEGAFRVGHFDGVGTIVEKLLSLVNPDKAYFGKKDYQQLLIIKKLVEITKIDVEIIGCPIVREANGLAMSSRNERLAPNLRKEAAFIYKTLKTAKIKFGTKSAKELTDWVIAQFTKNTFLELEYFTITKAATLQPVKRKHKNTKYRAFIAVYAGEVRLIDNIALN